MTQAQTNPTPQEAGPDLDARIADEVMGLDYWLEDREGRLSVTTRLPNGREPWTSCLADIQHRYTKIKAVAIDKNKHAVPVGLIENYSTNGGGMLRVWNRLTELGMAVQAITDGTRAIVRIHDEHGNLIAETAATRPSELPKATCIAALGAVRQGRQRNDKRVPHNPRHVQKQGPINAADASRRDECQRATLITHADSSPPAHQPGAP